LNDETKADVLKRFGGGQFSAFKTALADLTIDKLAPIRAEMLRLAADPAHTDSVLADGAEKARAIARPNMDAIKDILGLLR
jgi:tryptophanyl-tRNA synthetase